MRYRTFGESSGPGGLRVTTHFAGCLVGQAVGDALGFVVEALPPTDAGQFVTDILRAGRAEEARRTGFAPGQYTDDTQFARELFLSFAACRGFDPADFGGRIAELFRRVADVGAGEGTRSAARRILAGVPWYAAGTPAPYAGNGSAMRAAPLGLFFSNLPSARRRAARDQSRITHLDPRAAAGSIVIAEATALATRPGPLDRAAFLAQLIESAGAEEPVLAHALANLREWTAFEPRRAAECLFASGIDEAHSERWEGVSTYVVPSVVWALYAFLRSPDDYWETICTAIEVGGDTDTLAAMAGAISGARLGLGAIPAALAARVNDNGEWGLAALEALAGECAAIRPSSQER